MCGITGYVGGRPAGDLILDGLERLEHRGYDSAGVAVHVDGGVETVRSVGNLEALRSEVGRSVGEAFADARTGLGHTRWATHGRVTTENAHPHSDREGRVHIVLNGIVENHAVLRDELDPGGGLFSSETDAEVVAQLLGRHYEGDLEDAMRVVCEQLEGHYAVVAMARDQPHRIVGVRRECPLIVGRGRDEQFLASSIGAFAPQTRRVQPLEDGEIAIVEPDGAVLADLRRGTRIERPAVEAEPEEDRAVKGPYPTFMRKEIDEQPAAIAATLAGHLPGADRDERTAIPPELLDGIERVVVAACGTSYHAGLLGRRVIESWARVPVDVEIASEYRYSEPLLGPGDLLVAITQSGETADTLAAMRLAREHGAPVLAITNVTGSQATREADAVLLTKAGEEVGVAATKTFVAQVVTTYLLALELAANRGTLDAARIDRLGDGLAALPDEMAAMIEACEEPVDAIASRYADSGFFMFLGRHVGLPLALEGALKLKEVAYVACDAYAAGEMKHGPIALIEDGTPVVCVATDSPADGKLGSNIAEVRARGASVFAIATDAEDAAGADEVVPVPRIEPALQPLLAIVPLQLFAHEIARLRGLDVDRPRNLAKTVTVE
jgi:glucosamine--fructose-6-phosphate aminotransferase (isomerizing)